MKTSSSHSTTLFSNRIPSNDHDQTKRSSIARGKPEWQKNTLRVCGNWSEQLSSKGKVYFYNCITEVSQWQKPIEWTLPDMTQSELHKIICERQGEAQVLKRPYSSLNQIDKVNPRLQDGASSPKRQKCSGLKSSIDRPKIEGNSYVRVDQHNTHRNSPRKPEISGHGMAQRSLGNARDTLETVAVGYSATSTPCDINCRENHSVRDEGVNFPTNKLSSNRTSALEDKVNQNSSFTDSTRLTSHSPVIHAIIPSKVANIATAHSSRSPLLASASSCQVTSSDPQSSTSRSSSPSSRNEPALHTPQQNSISCQRRFNESIVVNNGSSLLPDPHSRDGCSSKFDRRSGQFDKQSASSPRTNSIKPDQVLRNLVSVLSHVVDKRERLSLVNASGANNRTPPINSASRSQPLVANLLSTFLGTHRRLVDGRTASHTSSPSSNKASLNGSEKAKNDRTPTCPSSSDGTSIISPCPRSSPSSANMCSSDFRNHPQKRHSPLESRSTINDVHHHHRSHSSDSGDAVNPPSASTSDDRYSPITLDTPEMLKLADPHISVRFHHPVADTMENEAQSLLRNFDRLHSVLYSELSGELKKLRALVCISETKLKIHQQRKESLQELMDAIESRKALPSLSSPDAPI